MSYTYIYRHTHYMHCVIELRYQPCTYEIGVNRLAFNLKYSLKHFFVCFSERTFSRFFGSTLASSLLFDFFFKRDLSTVNILPHLFHFMSALEPLQRAPYIYIENNIWWKYLKPINEQVHIF